MEDAVATELMKSLKSDLLGAIQSQKAFFIDTFHRIEGKQDTLDRSFAEFKEICHERQTKCRSTIHDRITDVSGEVQRIQGRHEKENGVAHHREGEAEERTHRREPTVSVSVGSKRDWREMGLLIAVGGLAGERVIHYLLKMLGLH